MHNAQTHPDPSRFPLLALLATATDNLDDVTVPAESFGRLETLLQDGWSIVFTADNAGSETLAVSLVTRDDHVIYTSLATSLYDAIEQAADVVADYLLDLSEGMNS